MSAIKPINKAIGGTTINFDCNINETIDVSLSYYSASGGFYVGSKSSFSNFSIGNTISTAYLYNISNSWPIDTVQKLIELKNGYYIGAQRSSDSSFGRDFTLEIYDQNNNYYCSLGSMPINYNPNYPNRRVAIGLCKCEELNLYGFTQCREYYNECQAYLYNRLTGLIEEAPEFNWECWPQLSGNAGMFLMDLSTIEDELIGDGQTAYETFDPAGFNIVPQSELYPLVANLLNGQESKIVFCGDNYITATRRSTFVNDVLTVYVTLKFYFRSDTLIYTTPELTIYSDDPEISRDYLCIIFDAEQEAAATNIIQIWASGKYGINEYALPSDEQMRALYIWLQDNGAYRERVSPYDTGTTDNGGDPGVPAPQDHITDTDPPTLSGLNNGIVTLYRPTEEQLTQISAFLWSDNVLDNFKKYFNNFADNLLNLYILPYTPAGLNTKTFKVGNMVSSITDVEFCTKRFHDIPMGSVNIEKLWDCYLDFAPYTKLEIYLPYLGMHSLDIDEFMCPTRMDGTLQRGLGSVLSLTYRLDILTGVIVAKVKLNGDVRYQFEGKVGANIPLTGQTYASMVQGIVTAGAGLISTIATGGLTAPMSAAAAVAGTVNAAKPSVERVGNISGDASMLCTNEPYIVISRPNKPKLINQARYTGFPSYKTDTIGNFEGFTQVIDAHIDGISCTEEERAMILTLLKEGVIL